ncbi:4-(cytidine 5'-diphospho)-2-C-methyl-D-erythritol kinase [candidate division WOR-3 bacterium]|nr:4-(cytidine 5'-diphospho)-2-C-methyl-D-erythritol kinase [candidate division WOR-3 bacterium]
MTTESFICPVKVNLSLAIKGKRDDGYHEIETVFQSLDYGDRIFFKKEGKYDELLLSGETVPPGEENLVIKAMKKVREKFSGIPSLKIFLEKKIPAGTGLGAGSSNAAVALLYACSLSENTVSEKELEKIALELGSDVPFFLKGGNAKAVGRGEVLSFRDFSIKGVFVILIPEIRVSTKEAYESYDLTSGREKYKRMIFQYKNEKFYNDFEAFVFKSHSKLKYYRDSLLDAGAEFSMLSGSGSSVYGFFVKNRLAEEAVSRIKKSMKGEKTKIFTAGPSECWNSLEDLRI